MIYLSNDQFNILNQSFNYNNSLHFDKALKWFNENKQEYNTGQSNEYIRTMLELSGIHLNGWARTPYQYSTLLPKNGFKHIAILNGKDKQKEWTLNEAQIGDIAIMSHQNTSHICIWDGNHWISDYIQQNAWPYPNEGKINIFRYE